MERKRKGSTAQRMEKILTAMHIADTEIKRLLADPPPLPAAFLADLAGIAWMLSVGASLVESMATGKSAVSP